MNAATHPLDPLTADEISHAVTILRKTRALADDTLFVRVSLHEPPKEIVLRFREGEPLDRQAFVIVRDRRARTTFEVVVSLGRGVVVSWRDVPGVQPPITKTRWGWSYSTVRGTTFLTFPSPICQNSRGTASRAQTRNTVQLCRA